MGLVEEVAARNRVLAAKRASFQELGGRYWTQIGGDSIGAKARELKEKAESYEAAGFLNNPRFVLATGFFSEHRKHGGIEDLVAGKASMQERTDAILKTGFGPSETRELLHLIRTFRRLFGSVPMMVRSSPPGDCRGTGIYESAAFFNFQDEQKALAALIKAIKRVLVSEFTDSTIAFRKDCGWDPGMAIMIEPAVGEFVVGRSGLARPQIFYGPPYSGMTHMNQVDGGFCAYIARGLPTTIVGGGGLEAIEGTVKTMLDLIANRLISEVGGISDERCCFSGVDNQTTWRSGRWFEIPRMREEVASTGDDHDDYAFRLEGLFGKLRALERLLEVQQYLEFALVRNNGSLAPLILQIADVDSKKDFYEFPETGTTLIKSRFVVGSGKRICDGVISIEDELDLGSLARFNQMRRDYLVIYSGCIMPYGGERGGFQGIRYSDLNNASVVIEAYERRHANHPMAHFEGMLKESGKIFMVARDLDVSALAPFSKTIECEGRRIRFYDVRVQVTASQHQQRAVVELLR